MPPLVRALGALPIVALVAVAVALLVTGSSPLGVTADDLRDWEW